jgi:hypothetical protein
LLRNAAALAAVLGLMACSATGDSGGFARPNASAGATGAGGGTAASAGSGNAATAGAGAEAGSPGEDASVGGGGAGGVVTPDAGPDSTSAEICGNHIDDDHNGMADEGCQCFEGESAPCFTGPAIRRNVGACKDGMQKCMRYGEFFSWGPCEGETLPSQEIPGNNVDEDCDGNDPGSNCLKSETGADCHNGKDDDCDGKTDCDDPECKPECPTCAPKETVCNDGKDEDCDGHVDCIDPDCSAATNCKPPPQGCTPQFPFFKELICWDNVDNDCDKKVDCDDPDCHMPGYCGCAKVETDCDDGKDEDCDGSTDCADTDCQRCTPGKFRWCDDPTYCHWGKQQCNPNGTWGTCVEVNTAPPGCDGSVAYSAACCVQAGECCQNYPKDNTSIGNCGGIVTCL